MQTTNTAHRTGAAPVPGRNSFTMAQASRRITAAGYTGVTGLKKDGQGIWRGQAQKDGAATAVSLDYQGNVTAGAVTNQTKEKHHAHHRAPLRHV